MPGELLCTCTPDASSCIPCGSSARALLGKRWLLLMFSVRSCQTNAIWHVSNGGVCHTEIFFLKKKKFPDSILLYIYDV